MAKYKYFQEVLSWDELNKLEDEAYAMKKNQDDADTIANVTLALIGVASLVLSSEGDEIEAVDKLGYVVTTSLSATSVVDCTATKPADVLENYLRCISKVKDYFYKHLGIEDTGVKICFKAVDVNGTYYWYGYSMYPIGGR